MCCKKANKQQKILILIMKYLHLKNKMSEKSSALLFRFDSKAVSRRNIAPVVIG